MPEFEGQKPDDPVRVWEEIVPFVAHKRINKRLHRLFLEISPVQGLRIK